MGKLKQLIVFTFLMMTTCLCFAKQIAFQVVQHNGTSKDVIESSYEVEDTLLNGFFNKGFIVTNSSATVSNSVSTDEKLWNSGFGEAYDGASDYFVQVKLYFSSVENETKTGVVTKLDKASWSLCAVKSGKTIKTDTIINENGAPQKESVGKISASIINEITKALKA